MAWGIQRKLVGSLVLAGLVPLVLALAVVLWSVVTSRTESIGRTFSRVSRQQADHLSTLLGAQIDFIWTINYLPGTRQFLEAANQVPPLTQEQIDRIEAAWPDLAEDDPLLEQILTNPVAERWRAIQRQQPRFAEIMLTDVSGRLIAATQKATDYFQADEQWWVDCYDDGAGRIFMTEVLWDETARSPTGLPGALVTDLCMPLYRVDDEGIWQVIGILKVSIDAHWLIGQLDRAPGPEDSVTWLVHATGEPAAGAFRQAPIDRIPEAIMQQIRQRQSGWTIAREMEGLELIGFAPVNLPRRQQEFAEAELEWYVIVATSRTVAMLPLYRMVAAILAIGLATILICFVGGLIIARREVLRPLLALSHGVGELARGNIAYRLPAERDGPGFDGVFRNDEVGALARDFNHMADELRHHVEQLEEADRRKQQFIDLASHELRTPVTYILGMSQLARRADAPPQPQLLNKMHQKAQRLSRIVENMFKLLQSGTFQQRLQLGPVNVAHEIHGALRELDPFLQTRSQQCDLKIDGNLPAIQADREKIRDILSNLISNAIRFSPDQATITISARRAALAGTPGGDGEGGDGPAGVQITITDRGAGIPAEDLPHLFEPFFTVTGELTRHTSGEHRHLTRGMGLGLSVVKRFVEMHGGSVRVETGPQGTSVYVTLPEQPPPNTPAADPAREGHDSGFGVQGSEKRVLNPEP